ncbi:MAG: CpsD/CapB family tyrosine-protein kinase [Acidobacteria bacterium]|nr:CpsD/CapB family tyrosine-protein kinase [Acidobacteriota bacterium]
MIGDAGLDHAALEQYRALALMLQRSGPREAGRAVLVSSALPVEGKSLTAANLALTLGGSLGLRTLLIDCDLRRPTLRALFSHATPVARDPEAEPCLPGMPSDAAMWEVGRNVQLLSMGAQASAEPVSFLATPVMAELVGSARRQFDWLVVDSPPAALMPDANMLAQLTDGVLLVVLAGSTPAEAARRALAGIGSDRVLGVVMNQVSTTTPDTALHYYASYGRYYDSDQDAAGKPVRASRVLE